MSLPFAYFDRGNQQRRILRHQTASQYLYHIEVQGPPPTAGSGSADVYAFTSPVSSSDSAAIKPDNRPDLGIGAAERCATSTRIGATDNQHKHASYLDINLHGLLAV
jgi:hypothetical protein